MMKRSRAKLGMSVAAAALLLLSGCATTGATDELRAAVQQAQADANEAKRIANEALSRSQQAEQTAQKAEQTANAANQHSQSTERKLDEMFRRTMMK
jgi:hypothetical protein